MQRRSAAKAAADKIAAKKAARTDYVDGVADLAGRLVAANEAKAAAAATAFELQNALAAERDTLGRLQSDLAWAMRMVHQPRPQQVCAVAICIQVASQLEEHLGTA